MPTPVFVSLSVASLGIAATLLQRWRQRSRNRLNYWLEARSVIRTNNLHQLGLAITDQLLAKSDQLFDQLERGKENRRLEPIAEGAFRNFIEECFQEANLAISISNGGARRMLYCLQERILADLASAEVDPIKRRLALGRSRCSA